MFDLKKHLDSNEKILLSFRPSRKAYIFQYMFFILLFFLGIFLAGYFVIGTALKSVPYVGVLCMLYSIIILVRLEYRIWSRRYALTNERLMYSRGIIDETFESSMYKYITDIRFEQSLWDKIMNTGSILIDTAGTNNYEIRYRKISDPLKIKKMINDLQTTHVRRK